MQKSFAKPNSLTERFQKILPSYSIYIVPLPTDIEQKDLRFLFSICGHITRVQILYKTFRYGYVFAYVHFSTMEGREKAKKYYNGKMLGLKCLKVVNDNFFKESQAKRDAHDQDSETVYDVEVNRCESMPKKRVHMNESRAEISRSFYQDRSREMSNSSRQDHLKLTHRRHDSRSTDKYEPRESSLKQKSQRYRSKEKVHHERESSTPTPTGEIDY